MDKLEEKLVFTVTHEGKTFKFRRPTVKQLVKADVLAAQLREGVSVNSLVGYGILFSDMIASLNTYVIEPERFDFGDMYDDEVDSIYKEVAQWLNSFHPRVPEQK